MFSSRKLERATYDSVAFRFIAANDHPDHDTIAAFRRRFLDRIEGLFVEVLLLAREAGVLKLGTVALDGTKVHANASRHSALSWKHACELEARLKVEGVVGLFEAAAGHRHDARVRVGQIDLVLRPGPGHRRIGKAGGNVFSRRVKELVSDQSLLQEAGTRALTYIDLAFRRRTTRRRAPGP